MQAELTKLRREAGRLSGGIQSYKAKQESIRERNIQIRKAAKSLEFQKYRRGGGRNKTLAQEFNLSERTISSILKEEK